MLAENDSVKAPEQTTPYPATNGNSQHKKRMQNYAHVDCGAKIVAANPGAQVRFKLLINTCVLRGEMEMSLCTPFFFS